LRRSRARQHPSCYFIPQRPYVIPQRPYVRAPASSGEPMNEPQGTPNSPERSAENRPKLVRVSREAPLPVSLAQQTILSYCKTSEDSARYVQAKIYQIIGPLDIAALRDCLSYIVGRHEILRTTFGVETHFAFGLRGRSRRRPEKGCCIDNKGGDIADI
jgi:hypothetical protein